MIKRRYINRAYVEEAYCDKCGTKLEFGGVVLMSYPAQYPYNCPKCGSEKTFFEQDRPGVIKYEFTADENISCSNCIKKSLNCNVCENYSEYETIISCKTCEFSENEKPGSKAACCYCSNYSEYKEKINNV